MDVLPAEAVAADRGAFLRWAQAFLRMCLRLRHSGARKEGDRRGDFGGLGGREVERQAPQAQRGYTMGLDLGQCRGGWNVMVMMRRGEMWLYSLIRSCGLYYPSFVLCAAGCLFVEVPIIPSFSLSVFFLHLA